MEQSVECWHRGEAESAKAYRGFMTYLSLDADRSLTKVARKCRVSQSIINRWSAQHSWVERAREYDNHVSELRLARLAAAREKLADEQIAIAAQMFTRVKSALHSLRGKRLNAMGTARLFYVASQAIESVFGHEEPLAKRPPKIVVVQVEKNRARDFEAEARAAAERIQ